MLATEKTSLHFSQMQRSLTARLYSRSSVSEVVEPPQSAVYAQEKSAHCFLTDNKEAQPHLRQPVRTVIEDRKRAISFLLLMFAQAVSLFSAYFCHRYKDTSTQDERYFSDHYRHRTPLDLSLFCEACCSLSRSRRSLRLSLLASSRR